jgi:hypothetical protein
MKSMATHQDSQAQYCDQLVFIYHGGSRQASSLQQCYCQKNFILLLAPNFAEKTTRHIKQFSPSTSFWSGKKSKELALLEHIMPSFFRLQCC